MKHDLQLSSPEFYRRTADIMLRLSPYLGWPTYNYLPHGLSEEWLEGFIQRAVEQAPSPLHEAGPEIYDFFAGFHELCQLLSVSPVYIDVPGHRGRPVQSVSDAQAELANNIKGLRDYHAYVRLRTQDGVQVSRVKLAPPPLTFEEERQRKTVAILGEPIISAETLTLPDGWVPDTRSLFEQKEFRQVIDSAMADIEKRRALVPDHLAPHLRAHNVRIRSRKRFGTPREQVEADIKRRQQSLIHGEAGRVDPAKQQLPIDSAQQTARAKWQREHAQGRPELQRPGEEHRQPPLGRRSPKKKRED